MKNSDGPKLSSLPDTRQNRILKAASYAGAVLDHPIYQLQAKQTQRSAHSLAFLDCLDGPHLITVDSSRWTGRIGEIIHFRVTDTSRVMQVRVMLKKSKTSRTVFESGYAYISRLNPSIWTYVTKTEIRQGPGLCIGVIASDLAGNVGADILEFDHE